MPKMSGATDKYNEQFDESASGKFTFPPFIVEPVPGYVLHLVQA